MIYENEGRVLLLDDERLVRFTISAWLKASHFEVTAVASAEEALAELKKGGYDAVLSDVMLGVVDGFMFRDTVRGFNKNIPIIFLTALVNSPTNRLLEKVTADVNSYYAAKNSRREYLLGRLRQAIAAYRAERESTALKSAMVKNLNIAARVQNALLPQIMRYDANVFYSVFWRPQAVVSGDLFCWFPQSDDSAVFILGDIAGHGTPAALAMTAVMAHLKSLSESGGVKTHKPHQICQEIDGYLRSNLRDITYMAGTVVVVNFRKRLVRYMNAGGLEPLCVRRSDGAYLELNPEKRGGVPMGLVDGTVYSEDDVVEADLPEDALLCLYSDGFVDLTTDLQGENRMPRDMFLEVIGELVRGASGTSDIGSIPYRLASVMKDMGYVHAQDDETFCIIGASLANEARFVSSVPLKEAQAVNELIDRASQWALAREYSDDVVARLELLLSEHLENIRKHGLDDDELSREVAVLEMRPAGDNLEILAWDRGEAYEGDFSEFAPHPDLTLDVQNDNMATSGRGLAIVRKICRRVSYDRFEGLNKFTFTLGVWE